MSSISKTTLDLSFQPLTPDRWGDLKALFGERGAVGGCWCMWWRLTRSQYEQQKGAGNKQTFKALVDSGEPPGLLVYAGNEPVAWCSLGPTEQFSMLARSRILKPVDGRPVWSIVCLFIAKAYRQQGVSVRLLGAAIDYAKACGASIVEGYPVEPKKDSMPAVFASTGIAAAFRQTDFVEVLRRSETRPIMRYIIDLSED